MKSCLKNREAGFTLIEVLAATVIITILLFSLYNFFIHGALFTNKNSESIEGMNEAQQALELLKEEQPDFSFSGSPVTIKQFPQEVFHGLVNQDGFFIKNPDLRLQIVLTDEPDSPLYKVKVEVLNSSGNTITETYGFLEE